jgi:5-methylcytosine-specific restriction endonuclease McrA
MKERDKFYANEQRDRIFQEAGYACANCGDRATQLAHRIAKTKPNLKKYGKGIIHHRFNLVSSCAECNDSFNIGNKPVEVTKLVKRITQNIKNNTAWWERG